MSLRLVRVLAPLSVGALLWFAAAAPAWRATPNPARDLALVRWSGATGEVRLEVLDARGRRVGTGVAGAAGSWTWRIAPTGRRPLSAGVYFVRVTDGAGRRAPARVVVVR